MADFNVRSDSVNVEQIMDQIRARIREKRGVDYTEQQLRELAAVKLEKFIDPRGVRSDLLEQFRKRRPAYQPPELPNYAFEESTLFESRRGLVRLIRRMLKPVLKLFFNPNPLIQALNIQARLNTMNAEREARVNAARSVTEELLYEVVHNLVVELTRTGIEVKNLTMRVESLASRVEFNERRARALESVVVYKPSPETAGTNDEPAPRPPQHQPQPPPPMSTRPMPGPSVAQQPGSQSAPAGQSQGGPIGEGPGQRSRRRRRRRGRRGGGSAAGIMGAPTGAPPAEGHGGGGRGDHEDTEPQAAEVEVPHDAIPRPPDDESQ
jgi:hypothetical protein